MQTKIQSLRFDADAKLLNFIEAKVNKLDQFYDNIIGAEVTLRLEKAEDVGNKVVDVKIQVPGNDLYAKRQAHTFEEATDEVVDALEKQLKKLKEKLRNKN